MDDPFGYTNDEEAFARREAMRALLTAMGVIRDDPVAEAEFELRRASIIADLERLMPMLREATSPRDVTATQVRELALVVARAGEIMPDEAALLILAQLFGMVLKTIAAGGADAESLAVAALHVLVTEERSITDVLSS